MHNKLFDQVKIKPLIQAVNLSKYYKVSGKILKAVDQVNFTIERGKTLGIVGESGSGKSTLGKLLLNLIKPTNGRLYFEGSDLQTLSKSRLKKMKKNIQIVFQDPQTCLNPMMTIEDIIKEPQLIYKKTTSFNLNTLLDLMGLPRSCLKKYPHQFSGGQKQRIYLARALSLRPDVLILDEPISALDAPIQVQILDLLIELKNRLNLTYVFISHNLNAVKYICDDIAVMYLGKIMEIGPADKIYTSALHPYTQGLIKAIPSLKPIRGKLSLIQDEPPSILDPIQGCLFSSRCPLAKSICFKKSPDLIKPKDSTHKVCCHLYNS